MSGMRLSRRSLTTQGTAKESSFLLLAQNLRTVGKTVVADVDAELTKRFRIVAAQQKVDRLIIRAFIVAQKILKNGKNLILKAAAGKMAAKIAELADAAFSDLRPSPPSRVQLLCRPVRG